MLRWRSIEVMRRDGAARPDTGRGNAVGEDTYVVCVCVHTCACIFRVCIVCMSMLWLCAVCIDQDPFPFAGQINTCGATLIMRRWGFLAWILGGKIIVSSSTAAENPRRILERGASGCCQPAAAAAAGRVPCNVQGQYASSCCFYCHKHHNLWLQEQ